MGRLCILRLGDCAVISTMRQPRPPARAQVPEAGVCIYPHPVKFRIVGLGGGGRPEEHPRGGVGPSTWSLGGGDISVPTRPPAAGGAWQQGCGGRRLGGRPHDVAGQLHGNAERPYVDGLAGRVGHKC